MTVPDLRKLTDEELCRLLTRLAPGWLLHHRPAERRWVLAEAHQRGIDVEAVLGYDIESLL